MPSISKNMELWNEKYQWRADGEDWAGEWGNAELRWFGFHMPRLLPFLPAETILEIAPGHGRWTHFLRQYCDHLIGVDLAPVCINACKRRFGDDPNMEFHLNDGKSLAMCADKSVDLVFSFASLVHVEHDVMESYLQEIRRVLKPDGIAYLHHSNLGEASVLARLLEQAPDLRPLLKKAGVFSNGQRGTTVSASSIESLAVTYGLTCITQETFEPVNYIPGFYNDCLSTITPKGSKWERPNQVWRNDHYKEVLEYSKGVYRNYARESYSKHPE